tara:strand:+ start:291 stop:2021 length:1731 start_codon:yes stop_codon:yes gene_type:complete
MEEFATSYYSPVGVRRSYWVPVGIAAILAVGTMQIVMLHNQATTVAAVAELRLIAQSQTAQANFAMPTLSVGSVPAVHVLDGLTPSADQMQRGDCYLFAITGIVEDSYRRYGVSKGWWSPDEFLRLSRQAMGIAIMEACQKTPNALCPSNSNGNDGILWANTTEGQDGSDEHELYFLQELGKTGAWPESICAYSPTPDPVEEKVCRKRTLMMEANSNPLQFKVTKMQSFFSRSDIKEALLEGGKPLTLGASMSYTYFYLPCTEAIGCDADSQAVPCPLERVYVGIKSCMLAKRPMVTMKGEWFHQPGEPLEAEGGHAVNIVGYNDYYRDEFGNVGGYILRNTWADGMGVAHGLKARGSHSAAFFAQKVSTQEELASCPNPHSPRSWYSCGSALEGCNGPVIRMETASQGKVLHLRCSDLGMVLPNGACEVGEGYYMANITEWGSKGLFVACFLRDLGGGNSKDMCLPPLFMDDIATVFTATDGEIGPDAPASSNDKALCGYNFISYNTFEMLQMRFGDVWASSYDIEWSETSYPSRASNSNYSHKYDYALLKANTKKLSSFSITKNGVSPYRPLLE